MRVVAVTLGTVAATVFFACAGPQIHELRAVSDGRYLMGTALEVTLMVRDEALGRAVLRAIFERVAELDRLLSHYDEGSQISQLSHREEDGPMAVDPRVAAVLALAEEHRRSSKGAFDVTVAPLVRLWQGAVRDQRRPSYEEVAAANDNVGGERVFVDLERSLVELRSGTQLDLGGIAKGYALDLVVPLLRTEGVESALASFGQSSIWAIGAPPDRDGWHLVLRSPSGEFAGEITLRDRAASVSSSLSQTGEIDGHHYGHVIDPRTGWPLIEGRYATVIAETAARAEALSTALLVLSPESGIALVESQQGAEAQLVDAMGRIAETPGWREASGYREIDGFRALSAPSGPDR